MIKWTLVAIGVLCALGPGAVTGCADDDDNDSSTDTDTDTDTDSDADTDTDTDTDADCSSCHGDPPDTGSHFAHYGYSCATCHGAVVDSSGQIIDEDAHVDGVPDIDPGNGTYEGGVCADIGCHPSMSW